MEIEKAIEKLPTDELFGRRNIFSVNSVRLIEGC
jgi:hypothetical protein